MTAYEFTRFESDYTSKVKAQSYEASVVEFQIEYSNPNKNFREDKDYIDSKDMFIETTMSCDKDEAINWMKYYMVNAIAYGIATKNLDWRTKFLAAWDLFRELTDYRYAMEPSQAKFTQVC